jgi:hypothetical protein
MCRKKRKNKAINNEQLIMNNFLRFLPQGKDTEINGEGLASQGLFLYAFG